MDWFHLLQLEKDFKQVVKNLQLKRPVLLKPLCTTTLPHNSLLDKIYGINNMGWWHNQGKDIHKN